MKGKVLDLIVGQENQRASGKNSIIQIEFSVNRTKWRISDKKQKNFLGPTNIVFLRQYFPGTAERRQMV